MHHPKVKGLNPAPDTGRVKVAKKFSIDVMRYLSMYLQQLQTNKAGSRLH